MNGFSFDSYNQNEIPPIYLANPDGTQLYNLGTIYDREFSLRYNSLSSFNFTAPSKTDVGSSTDYYDYIEYGRLVYVEGIGTFRISDVEIKNDGVEEVKEVESKSLEVIFTYKKISLFSGTYNFYNSGAPSGTLLETLVAYAPGWTIDYVDSSLEGIYRTFDVTDKTVYDFLVNEVSQTYQCVIVFNSINKTVSAYSIPNATSSTDVFISFENLMDSFTMKHAAEEMVTALTVLGGNDLSISLVNPLGTNVIYNFDYYKNTNWMSQALIDALNAWEDKIDFYQPTYASLLTQLLDENTILITLQSELVTLEGELAALVVVRDARVQQGLDVTTQNAEIAAKQAEIDAKEIEISDQENVIANIQAQVDLIHSELEVESNFTYDQLLSLNNFIIQNTYTNTNFIQTDIMTNAEIQDQAQQLYNQSVGVLEKISQPRYTFEISAANFMFIKDFEPFIEQIELGSVITVEIGEGVYTYPALLGMDFSYDDPSKFEMILSNRLRLDDEEFQYMDIFNSMANATTTTDVNSVKWNNTSSTISSTIGTANNLVYSNSLSNANDLAVFYGTSGSVIRDVGAQYISPTAFSGSIVSEGCTYNYNYGVGYYTVIGKTCSFHNNLSISSITGTSSSPVYITLPATSKNITNLYFSFPVQYEQITLNSGYSEIYGLLSANSNKIYLYQNGSSKSASAIHYSNFSASSTVMHISGNYLID